MADPYTEEGRDIASRFNAESYDTADQRAPIPFEKTRQFGNTATRVTSIGLRKGGKGIKRSGNKMMRSGAALSRTGAGAVVGVPMMAAGAVMRRAGGTNSSVGRKIGRSATEGKKLLRAQGVNDIKKNIKGTVSATRVNITALSFATPLWFTIQLPLALMAIAALGIAGVGESVAVTLMKGPFKFAYTAYDATTNAVEAVTGINFNIVESWTGFSSTLFGGLTMLVFFIGIFTLGYMATMYILSGVHCFMGKNAVLKSGTFIFALLGYLMPVLNILPWFILWGIVVWRYPK